MNKAVETQELLRCPHCDSHELFEKVAGYMSICLVCFKVVKREQQPAKRKFSWPRAAIIGGVAAGAVAAGAFAASAAYEWHLARQERAPQAAIVHVAPSPDYDRDSAERMSGSANAFGEKPWYKGFVDRADSCQLMQADVTPKADVETDGDNAEIVHADSDHDGYALFYSTGQRTWVYASSEIECRKAINSWIWIHTIGGAL